MLRYKDITLQLLLLLITVDDKINYVIIVGLISKPSRVFFSNDDWYRLLHFWIAGTAAYHASVHMFTMTPKYLGALLST